jgi:hypothetical protein
MVADDREQRPPRQGANPQAVADKQIGAVMIGDGAAQCLPQRQ